MDDKSLNIPCPTWANDTRYECLYTHDKWLDGCQYSHIEYDFADEQDTGGKFRKMFERRPSVRLNLPRMGAQISSRKLFAGKHAPRLIHEDEKVQDALKWLVHEAKLDWFFLDAAFRGQSGSIAITLGLAGKDEETPVVNVFKGCYCWPEFDEANELEKLMVCYAISGAEWLGMDTGVVTDAQGDKIDPKVQYWFIRVWDKKEIITYTPIIYANWNPVEYKYTPEMMDLMSVVKSETKQHNAGFLPAVWIKNLPNGNEIDGCATFEGALSNCIQLDYTLSQLGRGINYMGAPQLMVKGRILNYERTSGNIHVFGPAHMLQLPPDQTNAAQSTSGADAKLIEMSGTGIQVGMEQWVEKVKHWTLEEASLSRKDPNTLKGTMSGKAIELIDEDFVDLVMVLRTPYGDYGFLEAAKLLSKMCIVSKHPKFKNIKEDDIEEVILDWPNLYSPDPQETLFLVQAITTAMQSGLLDADRGSDWLSKQIDMQFEAVKVSPEDNSQKPSDNPAPKNPSVNVKVDLGATAPKGQSLGKVNVDSKPGNKGKKRKESM